MDQKYFPFILPVPCPSDSDNNINLKMSRWAQMLLNENKMLDPFIVFILGSLQAQEEMWRVVRRRTWQVVSPAAELSVLCGTQTHLSMY